MISGIEKRKKCCILLYNRYFGRLAQLVRASRLHRECRGFESLIAHHLQILKSSVKYDWTLCFYSDLWLYRNGLQQIHSVAVLSIENHIDSQKRVFE